MGEITLQWLINWLPGERQAACFIWAVQPKGKGDVGGRCWGLPGGRAVGKGPVWPRRGGLLVKGNWVTAYEPPLSGVTVACIMVGGPPSKAFCHVG